MLKNKNWTTIVEAMVVMLIVVIWIIWMYNIYSKSQNLSNTTQNRLIAIDIAREWIEAMTNIRDTNWMLFASNTDNCWNVLNYDSNCITTTNPNSLAIWTNSYIIYSDSLDYRWKITQKTPAVFSYSNSWYRSVFEVKKDSLWFYSQSWSSLTSFKPLFTREIKISYWDNTNPHKTMNVQSIVKWSDPSKSNWNFEVKLETVLTNWKK